LGICRISGDTVMKSDLSTVLNQRQVFQRFEAKYIISDFQAAAIKDYIEPYVTKDPYAGDDGQYQVNSMYLDSSDLRMFWSSELGEKNRFKLRVRSYSDDPAQPVCFEIKRRTDTIIKKQRAHVPREFVEPILRGTEIGPDVLVKPTDREMNNLCMFRDYMDMFAATPCIMVHYLREPYLSDLEEPVRITFDRYLSCLPVAKYTPDVWSHGNGWRHVEDEIVVIMEVKFTDVLPSWVGRLVRRFELIRDSIAKYVTCVKAVRRDGIHVGELLENIAI